LSFEKGYNKVLKHWKEPTKFIFLSPKLNKIVSLLCQLFYFKIIDTFKLDYIYVGREATYKIRYSLKIAEFENKFVLQLVSIVIIISHY
jgi:hypothetical protein